MTNQFLDSIDDRNAYADEPQTPPVDPAWVAQENHDDLVAAAEELSQSDSDTSDSD
jgi:hypothetical protein